MRAKENVEEFAKRISREYKMSEEEGKRFLEDMVKESEETKSRLDEIIEKRLQSYLEEAGVPKKSDIDSISKKLDELEKKLTSK